MGDRDADAALRATSTPAVVGGGRAREGKRHQQTRCPACEPEVTRHGRCRHLGLPAARAAPATRVYTCGIA